MVRLIAIAALLVFGASLVSLAAVPNSKARVNAPARANQSMPAASVAQPSQPPVQPAQPTQPAVQPSTSQPSMMGMGPSMMMPSSSVAVDSQAVYIINGNQLWKVNKFTGQVMSTATIPSVQMQPSGAGAGPGQIPLQPDGSVQPGKVVVPSQPSMSGSGPAIIGQPSISVQPTPQQVLQPGVQPVAPNPQPGARGTGPALYTQPGAVPQWQPTPEAAPANVIEGQPAAEGASSGAGPEMNMPASIAVDESTVYVVRGGQFMRFNKDNLQFLGYSSLQSVPGQVGAGPGTVQPGTVVIPTPAGLVCPPGAISVMPTPPCPPYGAGPTVACPPGPVFVSSTICPPSTISVGVGESCITQLYGVRKLGSCQLDQTYIRMLIQANTAAIAYSQLAQTKATQPVLKDFATREIALKCAENQQLQKWLYDWYGVAYTTSLNPTDTQTYNKLTQYSGSNFDVLYMQAILQNNVEVEQTSKLVQQRVARPELGRESGRLWSSDTRQSAQLQAWLLDWYNVRVINVPCPICQ